MRARFWLLALAFSRRVDAEDDTVVVTGTRTPERSQRATVKTDVITQKDAERRGATNVAEALQSQPGVVVNPGAYGALGGVSAVQVQGLDRDRVLVLEDGERVVGDVGGAIDLSAIPISDLQRIEIVTGPTSSLYGTSAIGGVINVITAPPLRQGPSGTARVEARSQPGVVMLANGAFRHKDTWARLDGSYTGFAALSRVPELPDRTIPETTRRMVGLRAGTRLGSSDFRIRARIFDDATFDVRSSAIPGLGSFVSDLPSRTRRYTLHLVDVLDLGKGATLRITLGTQLARGTSEIDRRESPVGQLRERENGMQSFESVATLADGARTWVIGARFEAERFNQNLTRTDATPRGLTVMQEQEVVPRAFGTAAAYAQLGWKLPRGMTALIGARAEGHTRYGGVIAPRAALAWAPSDVWQVRLSGGRGFRAPSAKELGFAFDHSALGYRVIGDPALRPETSWGLNGDVTFSPEKRVFLRAGGFINWIDDLIDIDLTGGASSGGGVTDYAYKNFGKARTAGFQVSAGARVTPWLRADIGYDYLFTRDDVADAPLGGRPPHAVTTALHLEPGWKLQIDARLRFASDAFVSETLRAPGYSSIDLRAGRALWPSSLFFVGVLNVADVHQEPGRVGDLRPPVGRILYAGIRADFPWEQE